MRILLISIFIYITYPVFGQDPVVFDQKTEINLAQLLDRLNKEGYPLVYSKSILPNLNIEIPQGQYSLLEILDRLSVFNINYEKKGETYLIDASQVNRSKRISGYVRDIQSGEALIGATLSLTDRKHGVITNNYGYYALSVNPGERVLTIKYMGYYQIIDTIQVYKNEIREYNLYPESIELKAVTVESRDSYYNLNSMIPGQKYLSYPQSGEIPYFLGEVDVIQKSMLLPGIRTLGEDASGLNVRGGDIDQNLILLDEAVIYNPNHFYGLISVFNPEAINRVQVMKGFIPPSYGGRISSVITVHQKDGNKNKFGLSGGLGILSARLMAEGPISKGRGSFLVSGRQSLYGLSLEAFNNSFFKRSNTSFQDINLKLNWSLNNSNKLFLSGYFGDDRNVTGFDAIRKWGNRTLSLRWTHSYGKRFFANYSGIFNDYVYRVTDPVEAGSFIGKSSILDYTLKLNHQYFQNIHSYFEFGGDATFHRLKPGERLPFDEGISSTNPLSLDKEHGIEYGFYAGHEFDFNHKTKISYGIRYAGLVTYGPSDVFFYDNSGPRSLNTISDTIHVDHRKILDSFSGIEPRISLNSKFSSNNAVKLAYNRSRQYIHLISNTAAPAPTDIWKLSDRYIKPVSADHFSLGYYQNFDEGRWQTSVELYYKNLKNLVEYKDGADLLFNPNPETELLNGTGRAYGIEYYLEKSSGKYRGWISYTLSRSERKVKGQYAEETINNGEFYPEDHDKTHDLSVVGIMDINDQWGFSLTFNYSSGRPTTFPSGKYKINNIIVPHFEGRNQNRISDYHRMDLSFKWRPKSKALGKLKLTKQYWTLNIYNLYARDNAYSYLYRQSEDDPEVTEVIRNSIIRTIVPSINYSFKF